MFFEIFGNSPLIENLARTLLHSVWQIGLVAFCLFLILRFISRSNANLRYFLSVSALSLSLILPVTTFFYVSQFSFNSNASKISSAKISENVQKQTLDSEEYFISSSQFSNSQKAVAKSSINNFQNNLEQTLSAYSPVLVAFWLIGMMLFSMRLFGGFRRLHAFKTKEISEADFAWQIKFAELCEKLEISQKVRLLQSNLIESPMVIGWIKPVILVPASVFLQMDAKHLETIIAHELMHIKRFDFPVNFVQSFIEILFFYHPCIWWMSAEIRRERECACDDAVIDILENAQFTYANALANLEEFRNLNAKQNNPQISIAANGGKLMNRIQRILIKEKTRKSRLQNSLWSASLASMLILALMLTVFWANAQADVNEKRNWNYNSERKMAVGFVSIPPNFREADKSFDETAKLLIEKLQQNKIPAIGFVTGEKAIKDKAMTKANKEIVKMWRDAGLEIGVGGFQHIRFYDVNYEFFQTNTKANIAAVKYLLADKNDEVKFFSYPFLNTGKNPEDKIRFEEWLAENNLRSVPYTFDNQEWMYSFAYDEARKQKKAELMRQIKHEFLEYMEKMVVHFESYSNELFGREIPQTLVLTPSRLVADSSDELFGMFRNRGYEFISMEEALKDNAYEESETFAGRAGISWMERWALTRGIKLRDEPKVNREIDNAWKNRNTDDSLKMPPPVPVAAPTPPKPPRPPAPPAAPKPPAPPSTLGDLPPKPPAPPRPPKPPKPPKPSESDEAVLPQQKLSGKTANI